MYFYFHGSCFFLFFFFFFFVLFLFFRVDASGTLHFYSGFSVNPLEGVEILVYLLWPSTWQAKPRPGQKLSSGPLGSELGAM